MLIIVSLYKSFGVDVVSMTIDSRAAACGRRGGGSRALASENDTDDMLASRCSWEDCTLLLVERLEASHNVPLGSVAASGCL